MERLHVDKGMPAATMFQFYRRALEAYEKVFDSWVFIWWRGVLVVALWALLQLMVVPLPAADPLGFAAFVFLGLVPAFAYLAWSRVVRTPSWWDTADEDYRRVMDGVDSSLYAQWAYDAYEAARVQRRINDRARLVVYGLALVLGSGLIIQLM